MQEVVGELWSYYGKPNHVICITTNGTIKANGEIVMGRGCALEAKRMFPGLPKLLGDWVKENGNVPMMIRADHGVVAIMSFPVKWDWKDKASLKLIEASAAVLELYAKANPIVTFVLPRPGCGNGRLTWEAVKPLLKDLPDNVLVISKEVNP